jgi:16S rRNA (guanine527-N7)-methyltransferase
MADLGTGGGLPGIPLAICRPDWQIHLMEAVQKKTVFLQHIVSKFQLENVKVHPARIEDSSKNLEKSISICISRAFSDFGKFISLSEPMLQDGGQVWAMKAKLLQEDLKTIPANWQITKNYLLQVPGLEAERRLFELEPVRALKV